MNCLVLSFSNAKLPKFDKNPKGIEKFMEFKILDLDGSRTRAESEWMDVPVGTLSHKHVANVLRVLANERPISTFRKSLYSNSYIFEELAKNALVRMSPITHGSIVKNSKTNEDEYIYEMSAAKKSIKNSWDKGFRPTITLNGNILKMETVLPTWERMRLYLQDSYTQFVELVVNVLTKDALSFTMIKVLELLNQNNQNPLVIDFMSNLKQYTPLKSIVIDGKVSGQYFHSSGYGELKHWMMQLVSNTPIKVAKLKGEIFIPLTEEQTKLFENGPGVATILDGGLVCIETITEMSESLVHNAKPVYVYEYQSSKLSDTQVSHTPKQIVTTSKVTQPKYYTTGDSNATF